MITGLSGTISSKEANRVAISTPGGVVYDLAVPLGVLERMPEEGSKIELLTHLVVREDGWFLFGFDQARDKAIFQKLLGASGVGPKLALAMLSALGGGRLLKAVSTADVGLLCTVPGVGKRTAEKLIVELKGRIKGIPADGVETTPTPVADQAVQALLNLGYGSADAERAVRTSVSVDGNESVSAVIKRALQELTTRK